MNRRHFLAQSGAFTLAMTAPAIFNTRGAAGAAHAAMLEQADFQLPQRLPQVINLFMYGGASELAGNLTNIEQIDAISQNRYPEELLRPMFGDEGQLTANGFWRDAGGLSMESMLSNGDMSVYRTINRLKDNTRAHRQSIYSSQKGSLAIDASPGMGSTIAAIMEANRSQLDGSTQLGGKTIDELVLPFVSFEGTSVAFSADNDVPLPLRLRGLSLSENFDNPYSRSDDYYAPELDAIIRQVESSVLRTRYSKVQGGFALRARMEALIGNLQAAADNPLPLLPVNPADGSMDADADPDTGYLRYPENNAFSNRLKAAVTLAVENPDSLFISLGDGLGSWDDHDSSIQEYAPRMQQLMAALQAATKHIRYADVRHGGARDTSNIIINVHGDFGRNVNLNNSMGWDHGNNQNLYTFCGHGVRGRSALGKIVGETEVFGSANDNRLYTRPTQNSYQAEPMSIAASTYRYFGVKNPTVLTRDELYNPSGDNALDESTEGIPLV